MKDASMSLGIYFEIKDAELYEDGRRQAPVPTQQRDIYIQRPGSRAETFGRSHQA